MEDYSQENQRQSDFNSGIAIIIRINDLIVASHRHALQSNFISWNFCLDRIWRELTIDASKEEKEMFSKIDEIFDKRYDEYKSGLVKKKAVYEILNTKEDFLRYIQNKLGMGVKYADDAESYLG